MRIKRLKQKTRIIKAEKIKKIGYFAVTLFKNLGVFLATVFVSIPFSLGYYIHMHGNATDFWLDFLRGNLTIAVISALALALIYNVCFLFCKRQELKVFCGKQINNFFKFIYLFWIITSIAALTILTIFLFNFGIFNDSIEAVSIFYCVAVLLVASFQGLNSWLRQGIKKGVVI